MVEIFLRDFDSVINEMSQILDSAVDNMSETDSDKHSEGAEGRKNKHKTAEHFGIKDRKTIREWVAARELIARKSESTLFCFEFLFHFLL